MMISTKGRYALRVMIDLAEHCNGEYIPMKDVVKRQQVSQKYVERIMTMLSKANFVEAVHGKGGGYRLNRSPDEYILGDILRLTEGSLAPVACLDCDAEACERADQCRTLPMWKELNNRITDFFDGITIADLMKKDIEI